MNSNKSETSIAAHFAELKDPRVDRTKYHLLHDIIVLAICAIISGAETWVDVERFAKAKRDWFQTFLGLTGGIPSHDTFGRLFAALDPEHFAACFSRWVQSIAKLTAGEIIAIDGKTLKRSFDSASNQAAIHMVSAWASQNNLVLGQVKVDNKSNEITAIPKLLKLLHIQGCIVTIDAMGCQKDIAQTIVEQGADYVLSLKGNQGTLHQDVEQFFDWAKKQSFKDIPHQYHEETDGDHGRIEVRRTWCTSDVAWCAQYKEWKELKSFGLVEYECSIDEQTTVERRYFISSLDGQDAKQFASAVRSHWRIENSLHWTLDVAFREDDCRVRKDHAPQNFAMLRHIALNLLKQETSAKVGIKAKRLLCGWDQKYLLKVLGIKI